MIGSDFWLKKMSSEQVGLDYFNLDVGRFYAGLRLRSNVELKAYKPETHSFFRLQNYINHGVLFVSCGENLVLALNIYSCAQNSV